MHISVFWGFFASGTLDPLKLCHSSLQCFPSLACSIPFLSGVFHPVALWRAPSPHTLACSIPSHSGSLHPFTYWHSSSPCSLPLFFPFPSLFSSLLKCYFLPFSIWSSSIQSSSTIPFYLPLQLWVTPGFKLAILYPFIQIFFIWLVLFVL